MALDWVLRENTPVFDKSRCNKEKKKEGEVALMPGATGVCMLWLKPAYRVKFQLQNGKLLTQGCQT